LPRSCVGVSAVPHMLWTSEARRLISACRVCREAQWSCRAVLALLFMLIFGRRGAARANSHLGG